MAKELSRPTKRVINIVIKLSFAGILTALCVVFMKFLPIQLPAILPTARVSLGPAIIIFASIFLGPFWGMAVGALADFFGFVFDTTGFPYAPGITVLYALLGFSSYFVFKFFKNIKNKGDLTAIFVFSVALVLVMATIQVFRMDTVTLNLKDIEFNLTAKLTILGIVYTLTAFMLAVVFVYKHIQEKRNKSDGALVMQIALTSIVLEVFVIMLFGAFVKSLHFGMNFNVVVFTQLIILFINVPINIAIVTILKKLSSKILL